MFKYLSITVVWLTEQRKNLRYYSSHEHEKSKKNYTKSPYKYQRRPMRSKSNKYIHNYLIGIVSDIAIFVLKKDVKLQLTNLIGNTH